MLQGYPGLTQRACRNLYNLVESWTSSRTMRISTFRFGSFLCLFLSAGRGVPVGVFANLSGMAVQSNNRRQH